MPFEYLLMFQETLNIRVPILNVTNRHKDTENTKCIVMSLTGFALSLRPERLTGKVPARLVKFISIEQLCCRLPAIPNEK